MGAEEDSWVMYVVELDALDADNASFRSDKNGASFSMPREQWQKMHRPGVVDVKVTKSKGGVGMTRLYRRFLAWLVFGPDGWFR